ncbi:hypothetical protein D5872_18910 [Salmonella enterica subsp. enterica serovar Birkenhead]|nr:hypothetical protein LFZ35_24690 [Salmonella enterica subsp. enterica serovar Onderstepoort str. SA20060086]EBV7176691.1 hypothetical protein [Salmonella enterica subsp. enterica serovar Thompson]EBY7194486.1 hypothetical protein [Salmonella enterica subsp. enterica serovar Birkenhead]
MTGMCYSGGSVTRHGSSLLTRLSARLCLMVEAIRSAYPFLSGLIQLMGNQPFRRLPRSLSCSSGISCG